MKKEYRKYTKAYYCFQGNVWETGYYDWTQTTGEKDIVCRYAAQSILDTKAQFYPNSGWLDVALWDDDGGFLELPTRFLIGKETKFKILGVVE